MVAPSISYRGDANGAWGAGNSSDARPARRRPSHPWGLGGVVLVGDPTHGRHDPRAQGPRATPKVPSIPRSPDPPAQPYSIYGPLRTAASPQPAPRRQGRSAVRG